MAQATGMLPHEILLAVARGEPVYRMVHNRETGETIKQQESYSFSERIDAAKAAAPYFAPRISAVEVIHGIGDEQLDQLIRRSASEAGVALALGQESRQGEDEAGEPRTRVRKPRIRDID